MQTVHTSRSPGGRPSHEFDLEPAPDRPRPGCRRGRRYGACATATQVSTDCAGHGTIAGSAPPAVALQAVEQQSLVIDAVQQLRREQTALEDAATAGRTSVDRLTEGSVGISTTLRQAGVELTQAAQAEVTGEAGVSELDG